MILATSLNSMLVYARVMIADTDETMQEYSDVELINALRVSFLLQEASWNQNYSISLNGVSGEYEISPDPPLWYQILICLKMSISCKLFQTSYSFDNKITKVTNSSKTDDIKKLLEEYEKILQERRYSDAIGYIFSSWDDFFTRPNLIFDAISQGYR